MSTQPEALRLADALDAVITPYSLESKAAAELRRQFGEIESMRAERVHTERRLAKAEAQRDALLEALRLMMDCAGDIATAPDSMLEMALDDDEEETRRQANAFLVARAAIAKAEEGK